MRIENVRGIFCVLGAFLVHFSFGTVYTFGNMSPYIASYIKLLVDETMGNKNMIWIFASSLALQGITMLFGGILDNKIGSRVTVLIGSWLMSISVILTYFTIKVNIYLIIFTYGFLFGAGTGIAYSVAIGAAIKWYSKNRGVIIGIVVGGFGLGSVVFNQVQTLFINPRNLSPDLIIKGERYFNNTAMLKRVPECFLLIGSIYIFLQTIGCILLFTPLDSNKKETYSKIKIFLRKIISQESSFQSSQAELNYEEDNEQIGSSKTSLIQSNPISILQILKVKDFWILWFTFILTSAINVLILSLYKTFGQLFIEDDYFLAIVGSIGSIFNASSRIFWGRIMDKFSYRVSIRVLTIMVLILTSTFYLSKLVSNDIGAKIMFFIWFCAILANNCGIFALMPTAISKIFEPDRVSFIYGMLFTANSISAVFGALSSNVLSSKIGYLGIFEMTAGMSFIAFILSFLHSSADL